MLKRIVEGKPAPLNDIISRTRGRSTLHQTHGLTMLGGCCRRISMYPGYWR